MPHKIRKSDIEITAQIRRQVMKANLSINAQNVKVVSQNGKVKLRGLTTVDALFVLASAAFNIKRIVALRTVPA